MNLHVSADRSAPRRRSIRRLNLAIAAVALAALMVFATVAVVRALDEIYLQASWCVGEGYSDSYPSIALSGTIGCDGTGGDDVYIYSTHTYAGGGYAVCEWSGWFDDAKACANGAPSGKTISSVFTYHNLYFNGAYNGLVSTYDN